MLPAGLFVNIVVSYLDILSLAAVYPELRSFSLLQWKSAKGARGFEVEFVPALDIPETTSWVLHATLVWSDGGRADHSSNGDWLELTYDRDPFRVEKVTACGYNENNKRIATVSFDHGMMTARFHAYDDHVRFCLRRIVIY